MKFQIQKNYLRNLIIEIDLYNTVQKRLYSQNCH